MRVRQANVRMDEDELKRFTVVANYYDLTASALVRFLVKREWRELFEGKKS